MNFFIPYFFAAMFIAYFIRIHFANPGCFPDIHLVERIRPSKSEAFLHFSAVHMKNCFSCEGGLSPLNGGDSEDITRSSAAVQIGCGGACEGAV
jgi:hypothetical protein